MRFTLLLGKAVTFDVANLHGYPTNRPPPVKICLMSAVSDLDIHEADNLRLAFELLLPSELVHISNTGEWLSHD